MIRTAASIALVVLIAWVAIRLVFGFAGGLLALLLSLLVFALKILLVVGLVYYFVPNTEVRFADVWPGALVTTARTFLFASECYGTVATIVSQDNEAADEFTAAVELKRLTP